MSKLILVLVALRKLAKKANLAMIPTDTLVLNREALIKMYGPTVAAIACLEYDPLKIPKHPRAERKALPASRIKINKKQNIESSNLKSKEIAAPQL